MGGLSGMMSLFLVVTLIGAGVYSLYSVIKLKKEGYLFPNRLLYPGNCAPEDCLDEVGFMNYIAPRISIFGIGCIVFGVLVALDEYVGFGMAPWISTFALSGLGILMFIWYIIVLNKASKRYW